MVIPLYRLRFDQLIKPNLFSDKPFAGTIRIAAAVCRDVNELIFNHDSQDLMIIGLNPVNRRIL